MCYGSFLFYTILIVNTVAHAQIVPPKVADSLSISITAKNLSEDMSRFSSGEDELLLLLFENDSIQLSDPILIQKFNFSTIDSTQRVQISYRESNELVLFLLELDSDTPEVQIVPIIRIQYLKILEAFRERNYNKLEQFLGDEDILGIEKIDINRQQHLQLKGRYKLDKYSYELSFSIK